MSTNIKMIRGTTLQQVIHITCEGKDYELQPEEVLRFGVKEDGYKTKYLILKEFHANQVVNGSFTLQIDPEDTIKLPFKKYKYDLGLQRGEHYFMIIPESDFIICENITKWEDKG